MQPGLQIWPFHLFSLMLAAKVMIEVGLATAFVIEGLIGVEKYTFNTRPKPLINLKADCIDLMMLTGH